MELGELLRRLRGERPVAEVARELRVVQQAVYLWESTNRRARRRPSVGHMQRLLDLYGASVADRLLAYQLRAEADVEALS